MADYTYDIVFYSLDNTIDSIQSFNNRDVAEKALHLFDESDSAELYSQIILVEYDWHSKQERVLETLTF